MNILNACSFNFLLPLIQDNLYALALRYPTPASPAHLAPPHFCGRWNTSHSFIATAKRYKQPERYRG
jgi:hypothetical protein